jgi:steroid delta-isomerase-like uncharacterized protein
MSPGDDNKKIAAHWVQAINEQDYVLFDEVIAPDLIWHGSAEYEEIRRGRDAFKQMFAEFAKSFPDIHVKIEDQVSEKDRVVTRYVVTATHQGILDGTPSTGKKVKWIGINNFRIVDGEIAEEWWSEDTLGLMQQLDVIPTPTSEVAFSSSSPKN